MRHTIVLWFVVLMLIPGCASRTTYSARSAPMFPPEAMPVRHTTGPVAVGVDPYVQPERQQAVFDTALSKRGVLPMQVCIRNQGTERLRLRRSDMALEFPDATQRRPLPATTVARLATAAPTRGDSHVQASDPAGIALYLAFGLAMQPAERAKRKAWEARVADYQAKELQETTLDTGEAAHGFVFFTSPVARGFHRATLVLRVDTGNATRIVVRVPLSRLEVSQGAGSVPCFSMSVLVLGHVRSASFSARLVL